MFYNKTIFCKLLKRVSVEKNKRDFEARHITSVFYIMMEELSNMIQEGKIIKINNFMEMKLKKMKDVTILDIEEKEIMTYDAGNKLNIKIDDKLKKALLENIDFDKLKQ